MIYFAAVLTIACVFVEWRVYRRAQQDLEAAIREWHRRAMAFGFSSESRDVASQHLESAIHASQGYALLRRITGLAPLFGVIFTGIALSITSMSAEDDPSAIGGLGVLVALRPVFWGVVLGAALAIVNQLLVVRFESAHCTRVRDAVDGVPADRFASIRDVLGTFPEELKQILAALSSSQQTVYEFQRKTTEEMGLILTRVSGAVHELADSATKSGEKLRESAASHFDQVKVTTKEFGKTIGQMSEIVEKSNAHVGGVLSAASDQLADAQRALAKSMQDIQVEAARAVGRLEKQSEVLQRGTEEALLAIRTAVDDSLKQHNLELQNVLEDRVRESTTVAEGFKALMRTSLDASEQAVRSATGDLSTAASGLGGLASSISSLERQIRDSGSQSESGAAAAASLGKELAGLGVSVATTQKSLQSVTESVTARHAEWAKRVDASEGRLDSVASRLADGILSVQREVETLSACTKSLAERNSGLAEQIKAATAKLAELQAELKESDKRRGWSIFGGR
jgi:chromosome segregation ATPase